MGEAKRKKVLGVDGLGATGDFPRGKFRNDDEGGLRIAVGQKDNTIIVEFGKEVAWLGLDVQTAMGLANTLIRHARDVAKRTGQVVEVQL
jgi:hypothetical protein